MMTEAETEVRAIDAMCLVEQVFFGRCKDAYQEYWQDGIYSFRQYCWEVARHTSKAFQKYFGENSDMFEVISFDVELAEHIAYHMIMDTRDLMLEENLMDVVKDLHDRLSHNNPLKVTGR